MHVVIVGGAGFIGSALAESLHSKGWQVTVLDTARRLSRTALSEIRSVEFDFSTDRNANALMAGADALVHLGCTSTPAHSMASIARDAERNVGPSLRLFDAASAAGVRRLVFASSGGTVYGSPQRLPVVETDPTRPLSAYGVSKLAIESYLALYSELGGVSLRVANPYGVYQLAGSAVGVIARYIAAAGRGERIEVWGDGSVIRDYIAIEDVVEAFSLALSDGSVRPGAYNIGSGTGTSVNEVIEMISLVSGINGEVAYVPGRPYDVPAIILDCGKFIRATGWQPRIQLRDGVSALCRAYADTLKPASPC